MNAMPQSNNGEHQPPFEFDINGNVAISERSPNEMQKNPGFMTLL